jgi:hypothetical protein
MGATRQTQLKIIEHTHHRYVDRTNMRHTKQSRSIRVLLPDITLLKHYSINTQRKLSCEKVNTTPHYTKRCAGPLYQPLLLITLPNVTIFLLNCKFFLLTCLRFIFYRKRLEHNSYHEPTNLGANLPEYLQCIDR